MKTNSASGRLRLTIVLIVSLLTALTNQQAQAAVSPLNSDSPVPVAVMKLVSFCNNPKAGLDLQAVTTLVDYVLEPKALKEAALPKIQDATGAYFESDIRISFADFLNYSYNSTIPSAVTSPSSLRYSRWINRTEEIKKIASSWKLPGPADNPVVIRQLLRNGITPDQTTGVYYEYDVKRTLILLHYKGRQMLITISKQVDVSDVGKKGFILGSDDDWNYYYTGEPGSAKPGLGWVKSYIYNFFSVGVYINSSSSPAMVRSGFFQWIRAGWSGVNFVQSQHVIKGMKRHDRNYKAILESPNLPASSEIASAYKRLSTMPQSDLTKRYAVLQQARQSLALQMGKIKTDDIKKQNDYFNAPREQIIEELMVEYLKLALGKPSPIPQNIVIGVH
ncbi:MAG: hypothetical protein ABFD63_14205 [Smithella sp.]|jgi:hypothetical protein